MTTRSISVKQFFHFVLKGFVFGGLDFSRRDLMAVNIQRGRDHGLPDYNTARVAYGLEPKTSFHDIKASQSYIEDRVCTERKEGSRKFGHA